jgi:hypothetical protein
MKPPGSAKALIAASFTTWNSQGSWGRSEAAAIFCPMPATYAWTAASS